MPQIDDMPFFSIGYADKERLEVVLIGRAADSKTGGYDWIKGLVRIEVGAFKGELADVVSVGTENGGPSMWPLRCCW